MRQPRAVSFISLKGGVAKTTSAANLAVALASGGRRVLAVDLDPQDGLAYSLGLRGEPRPQLNLAGLLSGSQTGALDDAIMPAPLPGCKKRLAVIPSSRAMNTAEHVITSEPGGEQRLGNLLEPLRQRWEWIVIDTPPTLGYLTYSGLIASSEAIICSDPSPLAYDNLADVRELVSRAKRANGALELRGLLLTQVKPKRVMTREVRAWLEEDGLQRLPMEIPQAQKVADAPAYGAPVVITKPDSIPALRYRELADWLQDLVPAATTAQAA